MKMESPLEVLSRAVSIVQSENKANSRSAAPIASSDSGIEDDLTTDYLRRSPKLKGTFPIKASPKRDYDFHECSKRTPERLLNAVKYLQNSSLKEEFTPQLSPKRVFEFDNGPQRSPRKHEPIEYKRRSPKRLLDVNETHIKKIKLEEPDHHVSMYQRSSSTEVYHRSLSNQIHSNKIVSSQHDVEPRLLTKPSVPMMNTIKDRHVQLLPSYIHTYPPYPPLFILTDKPTQYSKLMETYDSIFAPKPPLIPPYLPPAYTKCNCGDKNCTLIKSVKYSSPPAYKEKNIESYKEKNIESNDYGLPNVDEHFRKSLGEKYDIIKCENINERPSSVDDHFAKALGQKWFSMEYGKCGKT